MMTVAACMHLHLSLFFVYAGFTVEVGHFNGSTKAECKLYSTLQKNCEKSLSVCEVSMIVMSSRSARSCIGS